MRADGRPHVTPLVAVWLDDAIYFATGPGEQKAVNLRTNRNVILTTGCNEWERGLDVVVEGEAVQVMDESVLERLAEAWATKWDGRWQYEVHDGGFRHEGGSGAVLVFTVKPAKVLAFSQRHVRSDAPPVRGTCAPHLTSAARARFTRRTGPSSDVPNGCSERRIGARSPPFGLVSAVRGGTCPGVTPPTPTRSSSAR